MNELYGVPEVRLDVSTAHQMGNPAGRLAVGGTLEHKEVIVPPTVLDDLITLSDRQSLSKISRLHNPSNEGCVTIRLARWCKSVT
ncbi:hypothetical protein PGT21_027413 [Puccinia graminis f. sp. tritici]|uniref:Uncharacterized protein n=1 Tax=Puccinia graminis f. sp. tritici TaxID=56615 RepID=A0A5B0PHR9_PUCGR|nr:hypothetical protein PGT21_027413 [Puccinia graminis f. sp. tritici]